MRLIDADSIVLDYSGLVYIDPTDCRAIAEYFAKQIRAIPTITPERKRGRWIEARDEDPFYYICSECGHGHDFEDPFCPGCGADMREGETDD